MDNILLIGGNGYIGSAIYDALSSDYNIDILDIRIFPCINPIKYNMNMADLTPDILSKYNIVILLAGNSSVKNSTDFMSTVTNNITNFAHILNMITTQKFIYASSSSVYGQTNGVLVDETNISGKPYNYYDMSKKIIDILAEMSSIEYYGLRFGTVCGKSRNFRSDVMINSMVTSAKCDNKILLYNKNTLRPILGMNDLIKSIRLIISNGSRELRGIYNLSSFVLTAGEISYKVANILNIPVIEVIPTDIEYKNKINSTQYDFGIDSSKFEQAFKYSFEDTVDSITTNIVNTVNTYMSPRIDDIYAKYVYTCKTVNCCRVCNNKEITAIFNLGEQPLANSFCDSIYQNDKYPLKLMLCSQCYHLQLSNVINPDIIYKNYIYVSGTSKTLIDYFRWFADNTYNTVGKIGTVLEIACNDGSQLDIYRENGWVTIGVDPAENIYTNITKHKDHDIYCDYWNSNTASSIKYKYKNVDVIVAQNVFAHTDDIHLFMKNCYDIMSNESVLFIQTSQALMIQNNQYDTVYHEHLSFFSVKSMNTIVNIHNMYIHKVTLTDIHGTSFLFEIRKTFSDVGIHEVEKEQASGIHSVDFYTTYVENCKIRGSKLVNDINKFKDDGYTIISYGASAKGNTLLNHLNITNIEYIVDDNEAKWSKFTPGSNIPIYNPEKLSTLNGKVAIVMLTWNFMDEIVEKIKKFNFDNVAYILY